ncbi:hypothetical protein N7466_008024 [Penicillium verhagenii]|uniref:uncharacterized protein n=1 Tax=Penicillium verhagenii TaxID=1562060 RepID=UPI002545A514|nr:uncharacterized protein N7466_008024 [Penicillium verhagenii]KAJ5923837.1 hypothetical protein N7466_008024 [Penicillium verhagenii]
MFKKSKPFKDIKTFSDIKTVLTKKRNKSRLLLALIERPKYPESPQYALLVIPKSKPGPTLTNERQPIPAAKYTIKNTILKMKGVTHQPWIFEHVEIRDLNGDHGILVCAIIAKVLSKTKLQSTMSEIYIYQKDDPIRFKARDFDSKMWCHDAYDELQKSGIVVGLDWRTAEGGTRAAWNQKRGWRSTMKSEGREKPRVPIVDLLHGTIVKGF